MKLYHGTFENAYRRIVQDEAIKPMVNEATGTDIINEALNEYTEEYNIREGAVFLFDNTRYQGCYDHIFIIDIDKLNNCNLYVADFRVSTDIYSKLLRGTEGDELIKLCHDYLKSFMSYKEYLKRKNEIQIPEFLYYGEIMTKDTELLDEIELAFA